MRDYGFTACSGLPSIAYQGLANGKPMLDFTAADAAMKLVKDMGFLATEQLRRRSLWIQRLLPRHRRDELGRFHGLRPFRQGNLLPGPETRRRSAAGSRSTTIWPTSRSATIWFTRPRMPSHIGRPSRSHPLISPAPAVSPATIAKILIFAWQRHSVPSPGTIMMRHPSLCCTAPGRTGPSTMAATAGHYGEYMYKAAKQFGMKFRFSWHWNTAAGDPYYALDCREDDYAWCNASPDGVLIPECRVRTAAGRAWTTIGD